MYQSGIWPYQSSKSQVAVIMCLGHPGKFKYINQSPQRVKNIFKNMKSHYIFKAPIFYIPIKQAQLFSLGFLLVWGKQRLFTLYCIQAKCDLQHLTNNICCTNKIFKRVHFNSPGSEEGGTKHFIFEPLEPQHIYM